MRSTQLPRAMSFMDSNKKTTKACILFSTSCCLLLALFFVHSTNCRSFPFPLNSHNYHHSQNYHNYNSQQKNRNIIKLTPETIYETIENNNVLIHFHVPSCGHCKRFSAVMDQLAHLMHVSEKNGEVMIAEMDLSLHKHIKEEFSIEGFPTVKLFLKRSLSEDSGAEEAEEEESTTRRVSAEFEGERTTNKLLDFLHEKLHEKLHDYE